MSANYQYQKGMYLAFRQKHNGNTLAEPGQHIDINWEIRWRICHELPGITTILVLLAHRMSVRKNPIIGNSTTCWAMFWNGVLIAQLIIQPERHKWIG